MFLLRILYQSMQKAPSEVTWRPSHEDAKILISDSPEDDQEEGTSKRASKQSLGDTGKGVDTDDTAEDSLHQSSDTGGHEPMVEKLLEIQAQIEAVEMHLTREHMKRVLGEVYLHTWITENTSIPTRGVCDFLMSDDGYDDRTARVSGTSAQGILCHCHFLLPPPENTAGLGKSNFILASQIL